MRQLSAIIEAEKLATLMSENDIILIHAGNNAKEQYDEQHLENAFYLELNEDLSEVPEDAKNGGRHPLPSPEKFSKVLQNLGIDQNSHLVIYDHANASNAAARLWWMLNAAGLEKIQVLNGGFQTAQKAGLLINNNKPNQRQASNFSFDKWLMPTVEISDVDKLSHDENALIIDVRESVRYNGETEPIDLVAGHIPHAINLPFKDNLDAEGKYLAPEKLREYYLPYLQNLQNKNTYQIAIHCGSGVTACHTLLAIAYAGLPLPSLYVGSWSEWSRNNKPIETKTKMKRPAYVTDKALDTFIKNALAEDIQKGDYSTLSTIPKDLQQSAKLLVKGDCILAGVELAQYIFHYYDKNLVVDVKIKDGEQAHIGDVAFIVTGSAQSILTTERLVLNCMQRMSGIATMAHEWDQRLVGTKTKLLDTRKTTPNFRLCEKWAVVIGGGTNHRFGLYDMIMLKDNHIDYNGSITQAVKMAREYVEKNKLKVKIEVETRNLDEVREAVETPGVDRIMLDNMDVEMMTEAVKIINKRCETEASGNVKRDNLKNIAKTGVDYISAGALTHSVQNIDLSLKAIKN